jgi:hypothetical protein
MRLLIGSVAKFVVQDAHCSVEIVRPSGRPDGMKILSATDGSDYSIAAARSIAERPWPQASEFEIVSVVDLIVPAVNPYATGDIVGRVREQNTKSSEDAMETADPAPRS